MEANFDAPHGNGPCRIDLPRPRDDTNSGAIAPQREEGSFAKLRCTLASLRCKSVDQRQPIEAFLEPACEIVHPALAAQSAALPDLFHGHA